MIVTLMVCSVFLGFFSPVFAGGERVDLTVEGETLSARLRGIPLKSVLERLESEKEIWFRGDPSLLGEEVTVHFTELPFEEALKRILTSMSYSFIYDRNERLTGVIVIGKGTTDHAVSGGITGAKKRTNLAPSIKEQVNVNRSFRAITDSPPPGGNVEVTTEERENFGVTRESPLPGGPVKSTEQEPENLGIIRNSTPLGLIEVTAEELENFTVIRNSPPPGGPVEVTEKEREDFTVMRNLPPPGGPVEVSAEELENFQVIRNLPPPGS